MQPGDAGTLRQRPKPVRLLRRAPVILLAFLALSGLALALRLPQRALRPVLLGRSDLVLVGEVVTVSCVGARSESTLFGRRILQRYAATVRPTSVIKGAAPGVVCVTGTAVWQPPGELHWPRAGWLPIALGESWRGELLLRRNPNGTFSEVGWGGHRADATSAGPAPLPGCPGEPWGVGGVDSGSAAGAEEPPADCTDALSLWLRP